MPDIPTADTYRQLYEDPYSLTGRTSHEREIKSREQVGKLADVFDTAWRASFFVLECIVGSTKGTREHREHVIILNLSRSLRLLQLAWNLGLAGFYSEAYSLVRSIEEALLLCVHFTDCPSQVLAKWTNGKYHANLGDLRREFARKTSDLNEVLFPGSAQASQSSSATFRHLDSMTHATPLSTGVKLSDPPVVGHMIPVVASETLRDVCELLALQAVWGMFAFPLSATGMASQDRDAECWQFINSEDFLVMAYSLAGEISDRNRELLRDRLTGRAGLGLERDQES